MKKIAIIIGTLLLLIFVMLWTIYTVRKNKIDTQYVSKSSTSVLSFAVDDLLLDNISSLFSSNNTPKGTKPKETWIKKIIFDAGISIPARIYLFNIDQRKTQFYGILAVKNYDNCFSFFTDHFPGSVNFVNKENGTVSVDISKHIKILFDHHNLVYKITPEPGSTFEDLQSLLQPHTWEQIGSLEGFEYTSSKKHICYAQKDKRLKIEATVSKHKTEIEGKWLLSQNLAHDFQVRAMDTTHQTITFWSLLPLDEVPLLSYLMGKYTGLNQEQLNSNFANYIDLQMKADYTMQRDSSITYTYDDDFNPVEETQVQERTVPNITHAWKYSKSLATALPYKMFYQFHKKQIDPYLLNSTSERFPDQAFSKQTQYPLYCFVDFETWPEIWSVSIFKKLKEDKVKATITTELQNKNELHIGGQIRY